MFKTFVKIFCLVIGLILGNDIYAQTNSNEQHVDVAMRMIGHQILLASGDSVSRVLPVEKVLNRHKISFESEFAFVPDDLIIIIGDVVKEANLAKSYLVEVETCLTTEIIYSFEINDEDSLSLMPCKQRSLPKDCYNIYFTIISPGEFKPAENMTFDSQGNAEESSLNYFYVILLVILLAVIVLLYFVTRKKVVLSIKSDSNLISIGDYKFDQIQMELFYAKDKVELTSKESDLLILLHASANQVVERDTILQSVWGDEGDYVGRTLDVFISKLRKKLTKDDSVKIVNVRGVGYKLIIGDSIKL